MILILCAHLCISYCEFFLVLFQPGMKYRRLCERNSVIWASKSYSFTSCKLNSAIYFSDCCWARGREPSGAAAELSPLLPRTRPGSVHCTPLRAADKVYPGHRDAYRGEWNTTKKSMYDFVLCMTLCYVLPLSEALFPSDPLKWVEDWSRAVSWVLGENLSAKKMKYLRALR